MTARLPRPGGDSGTWGDVLNDYLAQAHKPDGKLQDNSVTANVLAPNSVSNAAIASNAVNATSIADGSITNSLLADGAVAETKLSSAVQTKLNTQASITDGSIVKAKLENAVQDSLAKADSALQSAPVTSVSARTGAVTLTRSDVGLGNVDNTSDVGKPISTATQTALDAKATVNHTHTASQISDATAIGRSVVTATDAAAARSTIGAGTSSLTIGTTSTTAAAGTDSRLSDQRTPTDNSVTVAKLQDGAVTEVKLDSGVQAKLNQAAPTWSTLSGKPAVIAAGTDSTTAREVIGAASKRSARTALTEGTVKGGNVTVKPSGGSWAGLWSEWDWTNWIKPQVDRAIALGLNTIRVIGAPQAILNTATSPSQITQATYDSHWKQLADYTIQNDLRLYPCLTEEWAFKGYAGAPNSFQDATVTTSITTTAGVLAQYQNVIGFDVFQEGSGSVDGLVLADILALYAAIRTTATGVPLTTSSSSGGFGSAAGFWTDTTSLPYQAWTATGGADFVDLHLYLEGVNVADIDSLIERTGKPVLIGEFGADQSQSSASQVARYTSGRTVHNRPGVLGSLVWALPDQGATSGNQAGIWDNTGFSQPTWPTPASTSPLSTTAGQRTSLVTELRRFAIAPIPVQTQVNQPNLVPATASRPVNSTTGWVQGGNTYLYTDARGLGVSSNAAGNILVGMTVPGVAIAPSTPYKAEIEVLTQVAGRTVTLALNWYNSSGIYISTSTAVTATSGANMQTATRLSGVFTSPSTATTAAILVTMTGAAGANESMIILAAPRPRLAAI